MSDFANPESSSHAQCRSGIRGDLNLDGCVDAGDLGLLIALWGLPEPPVGDLNGDGTVSAADLGLLISNWSPCLP